MAREPSEPLLDLAERVRAVLAAEGIPNAVIGAVALAVHGAPRATVDVDLAACMDAEPFWRVVRSLRAAGLQIEARLPDAQDPLGGVIDVLLDDDLCVQVVNFLNPIGRSPAAHLAREAIEEAVPGLIDSTSLTVVSPAHLIALKLFAGGVKSKLDVIELLTRSPNLLAETMAVCERHRLGSELQAIVKDIA